MGRIIHLGGNPHRETEELLPWYVTGRIDPVDRARVEAHLANCAACQAELATERRLHSEVAGLPLDVGMSWAQFRQRLDLNPMPPKRQRVAEFSAGIRRVVGRPGKIGWFLAAQLAVVLVIAVEVSPFGQPVAPYHALGGAPAGNGGNAIIVFRPDASEQEMRHALNSSGARLVGGPTAADAYVLYVPLARRDAALARLRADADVVLAEPIDGGGSS